LFAFLAYRQNFTDRIAGLIGKAVEFRMLNLHLERLSDIIHTPTEEGLGASGVDLAPSDEQGQPEKDSPSNSGTPPSGIRRTIR
ncbi:MAG TPA: hypothetical protein DEA40_16060, partial [Parvularcula sp.]|nr:hypothetical protein [Parvularcula sp.]